MLTNRNNDTKDNTSKPVVVKLFKSRPRPKSEHTIFLKIDSQIIDTITTGINFQIL